jgi:hypothetical protein
VSALNRKAAVLLAMTTRGKKTRAKLESEDERLTKVMYAEYREENAKDLEREGIGSW